jgi:hypothetical protein
MNKNEKNRFEALAASDPRQFLYEIERNSALADIQVMLISKTSRSAKIGRLAKPGGFFLKKTWAVDPAYDGIKVLFNRNATGEHQSLRRALHRLAKEAPHKFEKLVETPTPDGRTAHLSRVDGDKLTPAALIESINDAVSLTRAMSKRQGHLEWLLERCDFCEKVLLPLLQKMPPDKSMSQYVSKAASKPSR